MDDLLAAAENDDKGLAIIECLAKTNSESLFNVYSKIGHDHAAAEYEASIQDDNSEGSESFAQTAPLRFSIYDIPALNFHKGVCNFEVKPVNFIQLEYEQDKTDALQCLKNCAGNFISRVKNLLVDMRDKAISTSSLRMDKYVIKHVKGIPHSPFVFSKENFYFGMND
ncbi:uncharacterized protein LOC135834121 [Planococcus citri]|uniref:uncharacterized protein LOC135834121 n=1 Tax=Planococcus citri TaxID=170843 RepID=UPI0031F81CA6